MAYTVGFGKQKGRTLEWLFFNDPGYVWWMIDQGAQKNLKGARAPASPSLSSERSISRFPAHAGIAATSRVVDESSFTGLFRV